MCCALGRMFRQSSSAVATSREGQARNHAPKENAPLGGGAQNFRTKGNLNILTAAIVCVSSVRPFYGGRGAAQWRAERLQENPR
jgi:hypothetical protein